MPQTSPATTAAPDKKPRQLKKPARRFLGFMRRPSDAQTLPAAPKILLAAVKVVLRNWKPFLGIIAIYGVLMVVLVRGLSDSTSLADLKQLLDGAGGEQAMTGAVLFVYLLGTSGGGNGDLSGMYQVVLTLIASLALIWTLRHAHAGKKVRVRDGFYFGMYPLVPFLLVFGVVLLQLLPFALGSFLFGTVHTSPVVVGGLEMVLWAALYFLLTLVSLYFLASSLMALYIVCLPNMQPMAALRSARQLVRGRRWQLIRKILFLPLVLLVLAALVMIPLIIFAAPIAAWVFFILSMIGLLLIHSYMYTLYRELL